MKRIHGPFLMGHAYLARALVELGKAGKHRLAPIAVLHDAPEAFDGIEVVTTMGR